MTSTPMSNTIISEQFGFKPGNGIVTVKEMEEFIAVLRNRGCEDDTQLVHNLFGERGWSAKVPVREEEKKNPVCDDCGVPVSNTEAHETFHSFLSLHARAIAVLQNSHLGQEIHDRYDVAERIHERERLVQEEDRYDAAERIRVRENETRDDCGGGAGSG